jgi:hypothetical protein
MRLLEERFRLERGGQANDQVKSLIRQASHPDNLAQMFIGKPNQNKVRFTLVLMTYSFAVL